MAVLIGLFTALGLVIFVFGLQSIVFFPLTVVYEIKKRRFFTRWGEDHTPYCSVIVPAYNEENSILACVESVLASAYPSFEVIVVNDGSDDRTEERILPLISSGRVVYIAKANGGKASALNAGIARARGEVVVYTDADSLFLPDTLRNTARWFADPGIHAVCGNDTPIDPETPLQKLLTLTTHIGTGFVRRALSVLNVMPIISGNTGAVRKSWLERVGGFSQVWGEDLDLTFKLQRARARIVYDSDALVACEVPSTIRALWRQRVRWMRSYLMITASHRDMAFRREFWPFSLYMPINWFTVVGIPILQAVLAVALPAAIATGVFIPGGPIELLAFLGYGMFAVIVVYSALLDRASRHLVYFPLYGWLILPLSYFYDAVVLHSLYAESRHASERWEKIERRDFSALARRGTRIMKAVTQGVAPTLAVLAVAWIVVEAADAPRDPVLPPIAAGQAQVTLATHFDAWSDPGDALASILRRPNGSMVTTIGLGAGRYEWNFFRWRGHEETWSNDQRMAGDDLLAGAVATMRRNNRGVISIVDLYAPTFIATHPSLAARGADGALSTEQVCFTDLVSGEYGRAMKEMIGYLSRNYDIEGISVTEVEYSRFCYDERCLASFASFAGKDDWPRGFFSGAIDRSSPSIGVWRSALLARFLRSLADSAHAYGKKFYVDVPIHYGNLQDEGRSSGLSYPALLDFADGLVVWDYFYLEGRSPATSEDVARFFVERYGADKIIMSVGLWGRGAPVSPGELSKAVTASQAGGARRIWITPNHLLTDAHWRELTAIYGTM